jgi:hypothetical protein
MHEEAYPAYALATLFPHFDQEVKTKDLCLSRNKAADFIFHVPSGP